METEPLNFEHSLLILEGVENARLFVCFVFFNAYCLLIRICTFY